MLDFAHVHFGLFIFPAASLTWWTETFKRRNSSLAMKAFSILQDLVSRKPLSKGMHVAVSHLLSSESHSPWHEV